MILPASRGVLPGRRSNGQQSEGTALIRYDAMCSAITACHKVDEAKEIRDKALAIEAYARQALNRHAERQAIEIRIRAERRVGQLLKEMEESGRRQGGGRPNKKPSSGTRVSTVADLGLTYDESSKWQKLAQVPEEEFQAKLKDPNEMPSTEAFLPRPKMPPPVNGQALYVWGRITDMERQGVLASNPAEIASLMLPNMRSDCVRLIPTVREWLGKLRSESEELCRKSTK
jgi:hypothetical protein